MINTVKSSNNGFIKNMWPKAGENKAINKVTYIEKYDGDIKLLISSTKKREKEIDEYLEILKYGILKREEK